MSAKGVTITIVDKKGVPSKIDAVSPVTGKGSGKGSIVTSEVLLATLPCKATTSSFGNASLGNKSNGEFFNIRFGVNTDCCGVITSDTISLSKGKDAPEGWKGFKEKEEDEEKK